VGNERGNQRLAGADRIFLPWLVVTPVGASGKRSKLAEVAGVGLESILRKTSLDRKIRYVLLNTAQQ
jgi:hypothetical protein